MLEWELTPSQAYQVLALFGKQDALALLKNMQIESELDQDIVDYFKSEAYKKCRARSGH